MCPLQDIDADFGVVADRKSGTYSIVLDVKSVKGQSELELPFKIYFARSQLVGAMQQVSQSEAQGLRDRYGRSQPVTTEPHLEREPTPLYREKEIIREIVKVRCRNCGTLFEERLSKCPHCGAPA